VNAEVIMGKHRQLVPLLWIGYSPVELKIKAQNVFVTQKTPRRSALVGVACILIAFLHKR
jgi:hypothetical protein